MFGIQWIEHEVVTLVGQRVLGIGLATSNDHDGLRHDPVRRRLGNRPG
jgi:hypothetical protein